MEGILRAQNLGVSFGEKQILHDVNVEVAPHAITAIIGPSGCGKTTLLKCFNNLIASEEGVKLQGEVLFCGQALSDIRDADLRKRVGMVFQTPVPFPLSIYRNMTYAPKYYGMHGKAKLDALVQEKLQMAGLWDEVKDDLKQSALKLSGGQQQRLCIARALTSEPEVLLLDEPCSALDVHSTALIEDMLVNLKDQYTIVIVTHNLPQARRIADNVIFISNGTVCEQGSASVVLNAPQEAETKAFLAGEIG